MADRHRCSLNVWYFAGSRPLDEALDLAVNAGFSTIELLDPYAYEVDELEAALGHRGLTVDLINLPMGDLAAGERGCAGDPKRRDEFRAGVEAAARIVERIGVAKVNALAGHRVDGETQEAQLRCLVEQLGWAAERLDPLGVAVNTELLNPIETPGFLLTSIETVGAVLDQLDGRVGFQLDVYHLARSGDDPVATITSMAGRTRHIQIADAPRRAEPGTGVIDFAAVFEAIEASGYRDLIGCEFAPSSSPERAFDWMAGLPVVRA